MARIHSLEDLLGLIAVNPGLARSLKDDPRTVAGMFDIYLTDEDVARISENLDMDLVLQAAESADSMAAKVAQGIGLEWPRGQGE